MQNCKTAGCAEMIEGTLCDHHRKVVSKKRLKHTKKDAEAYRACARWQRYKVIFEGAATDCFKCKADGEVIHLLPNQSRDISNRLVWLCNKCHVHYHQ